MSGYEGGQAGSTEPTGQDMGPAARLAALPVDSESGTRPPLGGNRVFSCVLAVIVGAVFGAVGTVQHQATLNLGQLQLPLGLVLSLTGVLGLLLGFRLLFTDRLVVLFAAIGVVAVVALFSVPSPGGSVLIPQGLPGLLWTIGPVLIGTIVVAWPRLPERPGTLTRTAGEA